MKDKEEIESNETTVWIFIGLLAIMFCLVFMCVILNKGLIDQLEERVSCYDECEEEPDTQELFLSTGYGYEKVSLEDICT